MIEMTENTVPRFVHITDCMNKKYRGITIAYIRTENDIRFAYSLCSVNDKYEKSIGRELTTIQLENNYQNIIELGGTTFIDTTKRIGNITIDTVLTQLTNDNINLTYIFADQTIEDLNMFDFKHAYLSGILHEFIIESL